MKIKIRAEKEEGGYVMVALLPDGGKEYPQEGKTHPKKSGVFEDAAEMYRSAVWEYNPRKHTITG